MSEDHQLESATNQARKRSPRTYKSHFSLIREGHADSVVLPENLSVPGVLRVVQDLQHRRQLALQQKDVHGCRAGNKETFKSLT